MLKVRHHSAQFFLEMLLITTKHVTKMTTIHMIYPFDDLFFHQFNEKLNLFFDIQIAHPFQKVQLVACFF